GNLYLGIFPQTVASAAAHVANKGKSIKENTDFAALQKRLGGKPATALGFADLKANMPDAYENLLLFARFGAGFGDMMGVPIPEPLLPPLDKLLPLLTSAGSTSWSDESGFYSRSVGPFPGAEIAANSPGLALEAAPVMIAVMLPALNQARERANRV